MPALRCASLHTVRIPEIFGARSGIFGAPLLATMGCAGSKPDEAAGVESARGRARAGNAPTPQTQTNPMGVPFAETTSSSRRGGGGYRALRAADDELLGDEEEA